MSWEDAGAACEAAGQRLVQPADPAALLDYVVTTFGVGTEKFWIGGSDIEKEGSWAWKEGGQIGFIPWGSGQPDNIGGQNCLVVNWKGAYDDDTCWVHRRFICETASLKSAICPQDFSLQGGQCIHVNTVDSLTWEDAGNACKAKGGRLLVPADANAFKDLANANYDGRRFWIGASDIANEGSWMWVNGDNLESGFPWAGNQPDNAWFNEDCLEYHGLGQWGYNDLPCSNKINYVCEACPTGYSLVGPQCLSINTEVKVTQQEASDQCQANGDTLAVVKDFAALQQHLDDNYGDGGRDVFWLGGRKSVAQVTWRSDGRCGSAYPLANGAPSICNPNGGHRCCSPYNWCGITDAHCTCSNCKDFTGAPLTRYFGPTAKIWSDDECANIGIHSGKSLEECKDICDTTAGCTAMNFKDTTCVLRECTLPVPTPINDYGEWRGYSKVSSEWVWMNGRDMTNIPWGPNEPNNSGGGEDCFNFITAHGYNDGGCSTQQYFVCSKGN